LGGWYTEVTLVRFAAFGFAILVPGAALIAISASTACIGLALAFFQAGLGRFDSGQSGLSALYLSRDDCPRSVFVAEFMKYFHPVAAPKPDPASIYLKDEFATRLASLASSMRWKA
jgi:hypothetical protein